MAQSSNISIKSLISLFEKKIENRFPEGTSKELAIHRISQEQRKNLLANILRRQESSSSYNRFDRPQSSLALPTSNGLQATTPMHKSQSSVESGGTTVTLTSGKSWPPYKYLEEPNLEKELEEISSGSQYENDNGSKISVLTIPADVKAAEQRLSEQEDLHPGSVKYKQLDEKATAVQGPNTDREKLRLAREASARDKLVRIDAEKRLKHANIRILDLSKQLDEKKKELLRYKTDRKDHARTQEDLKKQTQLNLDLSRRLSQANDKILTLTERLESIASNVNVENKKSASKLTQFKSMDDSKPTVILDEEKDENKVKLRENLTKSKRKQLTLDDVKEEEEFKTTPLMETKLEAKIKKSASHSDRSLENSAPVFSHSFSMSELTNSGPIPNLHFGLDRPKRKKNYNSPCSSGSRAHKDVNAEKSPPQVIPAM